MDDPKIDHRPRRRSRVVGVMLGVVVGSLLALIIGVIGWRMIVGPAPPALTSATLAAAEQRWQTAGLTDYDLEVSIAHGQPGVVKIQVRDGVATHVMVNGVAPPQRVWNVWTVPGQFDMLHQELDLVEDAMHGGATETTIFVRASFDPQTGHPTRFLRQIAGLPQVEWTVTRFTPVRA